MWCGKNERIASVGFTKGAERELALWDPRNIGKALNVTKLDVSPAAPLPFVCSLFSSSSLQLAFCLFVFFSSLVERLPCGLVVGKALNVTPS